MNAEIGVAEKPASVGEQRSKRRGTKPLFADVPRAVAGEESHFKEL
jgi:hypothetical protein